MTCNEDDAIAHVRLRDDGGWEIHGLQNHLLSVAEKAGRFAKPFGAEKWASAAGRWHDLGKYRPAFQRYLRAASGIEAEQAHMEREGSGRVDHSTAGAIHAVRQWGLPGRVLAYLISGHHAGLPDWSRLEAGSGGSLKERLTQEKLLEEALSRAPPPLIEANRPDFQVPGGRAGFAFWVRMLFSCLVDADFLDTEAFMDADRARLRGDFAGLTDLRQQFDAHMQRLTQTAPDTPVNRLRRRILTDCRAAAAKAPGFFSLTVPTGGGKTLSGMAFALEHALAHGKRRVVHVIPYTSIIEQTADIFRGIFGDAVIEHHSSLDPDRETARSRLAAENWDAPVIVTTTVQFFESLFAARPGRCRKLHNLIDSVVVLDEVQLLPPGFLQPILDALNLLVSHYGVSVVLASATQPVLKSRNRRPGEAPLEGIDGLREIVSDPDRLYTELDRVCVTLPRDLNVGQYWEDIAGEIAKHESVLAIVNTRRHARELHALLPEGTWHLSALMCGAHRSDVIARIREKLGRGEPVRVVSTQLVEAGVDLDFPVVYRAMAGLDSIAQAAGRCNREGRMPKGKVVVFVPPEPAPPGLIRRAAAKTTSVLAAHREKPLDRANFARFFQLFYDDSNLDEHGIRDLLAARGKGEDDLQVQFRTAARRFRLIADAGETILVRYHAHADDNQIEVLLARLRKDGPSRWLMRKLQRYAVHVSDWHFQQLRQNEQIEEIWPGIWSQREGTTLYHPQWGVTLSADAPAAADLVI